MEGPPWGSSPLCGSLLTGQARDALHTLAAFLPVEYEKFHYITVVIILCSFPYKTMSIVKYL